MTRGLMKTTSAFAVAAAAGLFATSAMAADLGGNCCADLEERVAELEATTARKGNRKVSLTVYGSVNKAILWHDDEYGYREGKATIRDNGANMSRFGFRGEAQIRPDLKAGYLIELGVQENFGVGSQNKNALQIRQNNVYLDSQTFGRVTLGQSNQVTDGLHQINLANALVTPGGMDESEFHLNSWYATTFLMPFDGGRKQGVYYRSPTLAGFIVSAGYSHNTKNDGEHGTTVYDDADEFWEVALRYAGEFNGVRVAAGVGYRNEKDNTGTGKGDESDVWMASGSVMHTPTGLFVSGGYGDKDSDNADAVQTGWWVMAGVERNYFGVGNTTLFGEYGDSDLDANSYTRRDGTYWGLGIVQAIDAAATDLYLNFRNYELDSHSIYAGEDANVVVGGMQIKF